MRRRSTFAEKREFRDSIYLEMDEIASKQALEEEEEEEDRKKKFRAAYSRTRFHKKRALTGIVGLSTLAIRIPLFLYKQTEKTLISGDIC
jgi:hypothetical protein